MVIDGFYEDVIGKRHYFVYMQDFIAKHDMVFVEPSYIPDMTFHDSPTIPCIMKTSLLVISMGRH